MKTPDRLRVGQRWREKQTGRLVAILSPLVHGIGPSWTYCDEAGKPEPHGRESANGFEYPGWFWHYSDAMGFYVWERFEFVAEGEPVVLSPGQVAPGEAAP